MQITVISDTHGEHERVDRKYNSLLYPADGVGKTIVHAGDITEYGSEEEVMDFLRWFGRLPFQYKIFIGGNHDLFLEQSSLSAIGKMLPEGVHYLQNSGLTVEGIRIWGSPVTPYFLGMAFNKRPGAAIKNVWDSVPSQTDILITHGGPSGIMDGGFGCADLLQRVIDIKPRYHLFGHAHGHSGIESTDRTTYVNAALLDIPDALEVLHYHIIAKPIVFEYDLKM